MYAAPPSGIEHDYTNTVVWCMIRLIRLMIRQDCIWKTFWEKYLANTFALSKNLSLNFGTQHWEFLESNVFYIFVWMGKVGVFFYHWQNVHDITHRFLMSRFKSLWEALFVCHVSSVTSCLKNYRKRGGAWVEPMREAGSSHCELAPVCRSDWSCPYLWVILSPIKWVNYTRSELYKKKNSLSSWYKQGKCKHVYFCCEVHH